MRSDTSKPARLRASWINRTTARAWPSVTSSGLSDVSSTTSTPRSATAAKPGAGPGRQLAERGATGDAHGGQRLLRANPGTFARRVAEPGDDARQLHQSFELRVAQ